MSGKNTCQWPSMEQFPVALMNHFFVPGEADVEQRLCVRAMATEKIDGTNFGVGEDGLVYGRRFLIPTEKYQSVSVEYLRKLNVRAVKESVAGIVGLKPEDLGEFRLYGELGCNSMYDYEKRGVFRRWKCFGAMCRVSKEHAEIFSTSEIFSSIWDGNQQDDGDGDVEGSLVAFVGDNGTALVQILPSPKFFCILDENMIEHVDVEFDGPLRTLISAMKSRMMSGEMEGLVVSVKTRFGGWTLFKWKQGHEPQPKAIKMLKTALASGNAGLLGRFEKDVRCLLEVALNKKKDSRPSKKNLAVDQSLVDEAIKSAMTKYNNAEVYFEEFGEEGKGVVMDMIEREVLNDVREWKGDDSAESQVKSSVNKMVRKRYYDWTQAQIKT